MSGGVKAALEEVLDGRAEIGEAVQAGLFEELQPDETGRLDAPSPLSKALTGAPRPRGRPPGSRNRRTEAVVSWLLSQHRHPLAVMMEAYSMSPAELCAAIGVTANGDNCLDVFKLQMRMAEAVAPYVAQRLPQAVELGASASLNISFGDVSFPAHAGRRQESGDVIEGRPMVKLSQVGRNKSDETLSD